jgi:hypothetical protein
MECKTVFIAVILLVVSLSGRFCHAADSPSKALFAYGAINAYMASRGSRKSKDSFASTMSRSNRFSSLPLKRRRPCSPAKSRLD